MTRADQVSAGTASLILTNNDELEAHRMAKSENSTKIPADNGAIFHPETLPSIYALELTGDCLDPVVKDGWLGAFSPVVTFEPDDFVAIFFKHRFPEFRGTNVLLKRLVLGPPDGFDFTASPMKGEALPVIVAEQLNPAKQFFFRCRDILAVHKCVGWYERGQKPALTLTDTEHRMIFGQPEAA